MMKQSLQTCLILFLTLLCFTALAQHPGPEKMDIYLLMGQSNMAGRGEIDAYYAKVKHPRVRMLTRDNRWVTARHPLHFDKPRVAGVGPGLAFGLAMAQADSTAIIGLVPCAVGGTPISRWQPGAFDKHTSTHPYDDALQRIREAAKAGTIKGVIWHQGEGDAREASAKVYLEKLLNLIDRLRSETGNPDLPFLAGELGRYKPNYHFINDVLPELPRQSPHTAVISSEGLWHKGDGTHFDSPSATALGRRYAKAMQALQKGENRAAAPLPHSRHNHLSRKEAEAGWELLFNGQDPELRWISKKGDAFPTRGWEVKNGILVLQPGGKGGDIITREQFSDFELKLEFKLSDSANTGIKYFVSPLENARGRMELNGPEFQLIDDDKNETVSGGKSPITSTGSVYLLYVPENKRLKKAGKWNQVRILAKGSHVEHWLNGRKLLSYERGSARFRKLVSETKFKQYTGYGEAQLGHILLQDHSDKAYFRNIKIRRLN